MVVYCNKIIIPENDDLLLCTRERCVVFEWFFFLSSDVHVHIKCGHDDDEYFFSIIFTINYEIRITCKCVYSLISYI